MLVPEVSLTLRALFSRTPSPSLLLQGEWRPLSHAPILPCPQSTPWGIFQQPPSFFPVWWNFMTSPSGREGGRDQKENLCPSRRGRGREACITGAQSPIGPTRTLRPRAASVHSHSPQTHIHLDKSTRAGGMGATDCSGRGLAPVRHLQFVHRIQITNKLQNTNHKPARLGTEVKQNNLADENVSKSSWF